MKKFNLFVLSILTVFLTSVLMACDFKKVEATFNQNEVVISLQDSINLDDYLKVKEVSKNEIDFKFSNSSLFEIDNHTLTAKSSGKSFVYATYKNNALSSMQIVVRKKFNAPSDFSLDENGLLTWNKVSAFYENENNPTFATSYLVEGTCTKVASENTERVENAKTINQTVSTNSFQLTEVGIYNLTVSAERNGYFDASNKSKVQTLYFGYMQKLTKEDLSWDAGVFSWSAVAGAKYKIKINGVLVDDFQTTTSKDLSSYFDKLSAGNHTVSVVVYDEQNVKIANESEILTIEKFSQPTVNYLFSESEGGKIEIASMKNVNHFNFVATNVHTSQKRLISLDAQDDSVFTTLNGLETGVYEISVTADCESGNFYKSNAKNFGKVYKMPKVVVSGLGNNQDNGNVLNLNVETNASLTASNILFGGVNFNSVENGFAINQLSKQLGLQISEVGEYQLFATNAPKNRENIVEGEGVFVVNSDLSEQISLTKVNPINGEIKHIYVGEKSVFEFDKVENATSYSLFLNENTLVSEDFQVIEDKIQFILDGRIENLFKSQISNGNLIFQVVAKTDNDAFAINSSATKIMNVLLAPVSAGSGNSTNKTYTWNGIQNADRYKLEIFTIDKDTYLANQGDINIDESLFEKQEIETENNSYTFENVGYYFVKAYALSGDENQFVSSIDCLKEVIFIAEKLETPEVKFGFNEEYKNATGFTQATGYFLEITNGEKVSNFEVLIDENSNGLYKLSDQNSTIYLLAEDFEIAQKEFEISVVAHAEDETLYVESEASLLSIERLKSVEYSDLVIDDLTSFVSIQPKDGVESILIKQNDENYISTEVGQTAKFDISKLSNFALEFTLRGTKLQNNLFADKNNKVYLDSRSSSINFVRLQAPSQLRYYDGKLTFEHDAILTTNYYVLDMLCNDANGEVNKLSVKFDNQVTVKFGNFVETIGQQSEFINFAGNVVSINLMNLLSLVKENQGLSSIYNQTTNIEFSVYAYQNRNETSSVILSSPYASLFGDSTKTTLKVDKMAETNLEFEYTNTDYILKWTAVSDDVNISAETSYQVYLNGEEQGAPIKSVLTTSFAKGNFETSEYYEFYVKATNPNFLESNNSNIIRIYKLRPVASLKLFSDGTLGYEILTSEKDFCDYVSVTTSNGVEKNRDGKIVIFGEGNLNLKVIGKTEKIDGKTTYYIDSEETGWTLHDMQILKPSDESLVFENNLLSWNKFAEGKTLNSLIYEVIFKDQENNAVVFKTKDTSINLQTNVELYNSISALVAGDITISVSAMLEPYIITAGDIYYALGQNLLDGRVENNHYVYNQTVIIKKLTTPEIKSVDFMYSDLESAQFPDVKISFVGNYGSDAKFEILLNDNFWKVVSISPVDEIYSIELTKDDYNNIITAGEKVTVKIGALSESNIPSSAGSVTLERATELDSVEFKAEEQIVDHILVINQNANNLQNNLGGLILKIESTENGSVLKTEYKQIEINSASEKIEYDLSEYISANLSLGGTIKVSAFITNYKNDESKSYYLACPVMTESATYNVLKSVTEVTKQAGGFAVDPTLNNETTLYVIEYGANRFEVGKTENFYFEIPNNWVNGTYDLTIYAVENGFMSSPKNVVSFVVNRIGKVEAVTMQRNNSDDLSEVSISWNSVENADSYILRMYSENDEKRVNLLYEFSATKINYTLQEIFGKEYQELLGFGKVDLFDLMSDFNVVFDVVAVGQEGSNNSQAYTFNAVLKGNNSDVANFEVDEFGNVHFETQIGVDFIYRFVSADGTELQAWKKLTATETSTKLEVDSIEAGVMFNVEVIILGSAENSAVTSNDYTFELDSILFTSVGKDLGFTVNDKIIEVGYNLQMPTKIAITAISNSFTKIYIGLSEDAIFTENVVEINVEETLPGNSSVETIYACSFSDVFDSLKRAGLEVQPSDEDVKIYFWSYRQTDDRSVAYVISKPYEYIFSFVEESGFETITKLGEMQEGSTFAEDYANTFAVFSKMDTAGLNSLQTVGFFVKISAEDFEVTKFVELAKLNSDYFTDKYTINLTSLFEEDDLLSMSGKFSVEFSRLQVQINLASVEYKFVVSDWLKQNGGKNFEFERLSEVKELRLSSGNLFWNANSDSTTKYYVYFIEDLVDGKLGEKYAYFSTVNNYYNASDFVGTENGYYLAVQAINEDPYVISSRKVFVLNETSEDSQPTKVYKNQINSKLTLKNGVLAINWSVENDFYKTITKSGNYSDTAYELYNSVFTGPFTFNLQQLLNNNVIMRFRFTSMTAGVEGKRQTFDINAKYLLTNLYEFGQENGFDIKERLELLRENARTTAIRDAITKLCNLIENGSYGIANFTTLFDDSFEAVQVGGYKLEYCLVGNSQTLNSAWYDFENVDSENMLYVNDQPYVKTMKVEDQTDKAINSYKVVLKKSKIFNYVGGKYVEELAENYVLKIYDSVKSYVFAISKGTSKYSLTLLGESADNSVTVFECDANGEEQIGGEYLMFYINHNNGDSLLGIFGDDISKVSCNMQIYAVGNDYSTSSKSELFNITFLGFGSNFAINDGVFSWTPQINRKTNVVFKRNTSTIEGELEVDGSVETSRFSLADLGYGLFDYIKFVVFGEIRGNSTFVDSEIYEIDNVYKLAPPEIKNTLGYIAIDDSINLDMLSESYSDTNIYNYMLYNNVSTENSYIKFSGNQNSINYYETGITGLENDNPDYNYKLTEQSASQFFVASLGTTSEVLIEKDSDNYALRKIYCKDKTSQTSSMKSVAVRSEFAMIEAKMLDTVSNIQIKNGVLTWDEVDGRTEDNLLTLPISNETQVVYKVSVVQYILTNSDRGEVETNVGEEFYYYTSNNYFDFALLKEDQLEVTEEKSYLKATVQALAMEVSDREPAINYVELIEGGYGYGNVQFAETNAYVIMGNGPTLRQIDRLAPIVDNSLEVIDGDLYWDYVTATGVTENNFFDTYSFVVTDVNNRQIEGQLSVKLSETSSTNKIFKIKFEENKGQMIEGVQILKVFATQGLLNQNVVIKSFAKEIELNKLRTLNSDDYIITSDSNTETLDLSAYFADGNSNTVVMTIVKFESGTQTEESSVEFNKFRNKMFILRSQQELRKDGYINENLIINDNQVVKLVFKVINDNTGILYSDLSDEFLLQRSSWGENGFVNWNEETQEFNWNYDGLLTFNKDVQAEKVKLQDEELIKIEDAVLHVGDLFKVEQSFDDFSLIEFNGEYYKVSTADIVNPVYILEVKYGDGVDSTTRIYTTTKTSFKPTIIGKVALKIRIKLGNGNVQSEELSFNFEKDGQVTEFADFNLFASGQGTSENPYVISNSGEFANLKYRMSKDSDLSSYVENGRNVTEAEQFYFEIDQNIDLGEIDGVLLTGTFDGVLDGNNHTISYIANNVSRLSKGITVSVGNVLGSGNETSTTFDFGVALLEMTSSSSNIRNINIDVTYKSRIITSNALMAGLVLQNSGKLANVNLTGFTSGFTGYRSPTERTIMIYSGIASINFGGVATISNCSAKTSMTINDNNQPQIIFVSGIVYTNYATIEDCVAGESGQTINVVCERTTSTVQVAGIAITNASLATLRNCVNNFDLRVEGTHEENENLILVYLAGIADLGLGTMTNNVNNGQLTAINIGSSYLNKGDIFASNR